LEQDDQGEFIAQPNPNRCESRMCLVDFVVNEALMTLLDSPTTERDEPTDDETDSKDQTRKSM
jgi:hypothetical protein